MTSSPYLTPLSSFVVRAFIYARQHRGWTLSIAGHISLLLLALSLFSSPQPYSAQEGAISVEVVAHMPGSPHQKMLPLDKPASGANSAPQSQSQSQSQAPPPPAPAPSLKSNPTSLKSEPLPSPRQDAEEALPEPMKKPKMAETKTITDVLNEIKTVDNITKMKPAVKPDVPVKPLPPVEHVKKQEKQDKAEQAFDAKAIENLLLNTKDSAVQTPHPKNARHVEKTTVSRGVSGGSSTRLSLAQRDALGALFKDQLAQCWSVPVGLTTGNYKPEIVVHLDENGGLVGEPHVVNAQSDAASRTLADSALRAVRRCAPFRIPASFNPFYSEWRDWHITFDPQDFIG